MAITNAQWARVEAEIDRLRQEADMLEDRARNDNDMYLCNFQDYGSELAGELDTIAQDRDRARYLRYRADFLEDRMGKNIAQLLEDEIEVIGDYEAEIEGLEANLMMAREDLKNSLNDRSILEYLLKILES
jgi:hypothetical protein